MPYSIRQGAMKVSPPLSIAFLFTILNLDCVGVLAKSSGASLSIRRRQLEQVEQGVNHQHSESKDNQPMPVETKGKQYESEVVMQWMLCFNLTLCSAGLLLFTLLKHVPARLRFRRRTTLKKPKRDARERRHNASNVS